ncbi:acyl-CoA dehydrogenase [Pikeienuella piscinae]|uniref:Acyl-CoA dehydrogenase n=1 Tax=Pikeienuella piscinae TaxID=2748098 RepID=A0A7L5BZY3_9RHOB|nr:acyl-CoA dehydrogenase family protein [Pikeienuella piscinae]QIE56683.1 acyl-CoA dehydrogenase [Pikeienuella piscinae]
MNETDEEIAAIVRTARSFVETRLRPRENAIDRADLIPENVIAALRSEALKLGLFAFNMPESLGGLGLGPRAVAAVEEVMGLTSMPLAEAFGHLPMSLVHVADHQRDWLLDPLMRAEKTVAYALTEPGGGTDLSSIRTRAVREGDAWRLNGSKTFISHCTTADYIIVLAATDTDARLSQRLTAFVVPADAPGLTLDAPFRKLGWHGYPIAGFSLQDVLVSNANVLGEPGQGLAVMMSTINTDRRWSANRANGMAMRLMELVVPHVKDRVVGGTPLADKQAIQIMLADCDVDLETSRLLALRAAEAAADGADVAVWSSRAKLYATEALTRIADRVLQIFGGAGFMADLPVERIYRDARGLRIGEGTSEIQRLTIARALLA